MKRKRRTARVTAALVIAMTVALAAAGAAAAQVTITSPGPMASIAVSGDLSCQVTMANDTQGVFFQGGQPGACGTFLQTNPLGASFDSGRAELFSPAGLPGGTQVTTQNYVPVSQSPVTGSGTSASPYTVTTVVNACVPQVPDPPHPQCPAGDAWVAQLQETDSYVVGSNLYTTQLVITNDSEQALAGTLYRTGDCFLAVDTGYGALGGPGQNAPECTLTPGNVPPDRMMSFIPVTAGSNYYEGAYTTAASPRGTSFWSYVTPAGAQYPNTIDVTSNQDNGMGLSWPYSLPTDGTATFSYETLVEPNHPPANSAGPVISGSVNVGSTLSCLPGTWTSAAPITYTYQWQRGATPITGATNSTYTTTGADDGFSITCQVTAYSAYGYARATSAAVVLQPPPPVLGKEANFIPVSGTVYVKPPAGASIAAFTPNFTTGTGFVLLTAARQLPVGTQVDARHGKLRLVTARTRAKKHKRTVTETGVFSGGLFKVTQSGSVRLRGLTKLKLLDNGAFPGAPSYTACTAGGKHGARVAVIAKKKPLSSKVLNTLGANEHGSYSTQGKYSAATVRGTRFTVSDRCDGTLTHVTRGVVVVTDYRTHKRVTLHSGQSFLAKP